MSMLPTPDESTHSAPCHPCRERMTALEQENRQLHERLRQAELILDIQDKTLQLFGVSLGFGRKDDPGPRVRAV